jgi:hypothetical protein
MNFKKYNFYMSMGSFVFIVAALWAVKVAAGAGDRIEVLSQLYNGTEVKGSEDISKYKGKAAAYQIRGVWRKKAYIFNYEQFAANYGEGVEFQLRREQVILCPQTVDYLYSKFTPSVVKYVKGSRPELEKEVNTAIANCKKNQEKALALMRFCRDLKEKDTIKWGQGYVFGGTEEYIIEEGSDICECLGRLYVALCEIAGLPARIVMHDIGGHITAEVNIDGSWGYIDPKTGLYFLKKDNTLASTWEVWTNPSLMHTQSDAVKADLKDKPGWEEKIKKCEDQYFNIKEVIGFENYTLSDCSKYNYTVLTWDEAVRAGLFRVNEAYTYATNQVFGVVKKGRPNNRHDVKTESGISYEALVPESLGYVCEVQQKGITFSRSFKINIDFEFTQVAASCNKINAELICCLRPLASGEELTVFVNGEGPIAISDVEKSKDTPVGKGINHQIKIEPDWLWQGDNIIRFVYHSKSDNAKIDLQYEKVEIILTSND